jgi:hypothetical protein
MAEGTDPNRPTLGPNGSFASPRAPAQPRLESGVDTANDALGAATDQVRGLDLRAQVDQHPWTALGVAALTGYVLGSVGGSDEHERREPASYRQYDARQRDDQPAAMASAQHEARRAATQPPSAYASAPGGGIWGSVLDQFSGELRTLTTAAVGTAVAMLRDTLSESVPQFAQEYERRSRDATRPADGVNGGPTEIGNGGMRASSPASFASRSGPFDPAI